MKQVLIFLGVVRLPEQKLKPSELVEYELEQLTKNPPRTKAEHQFHGWLLEWKEQNAKVVGK